MSWEYGDWYEKNKEERNRKRREKYKKDPVYREEKQDEAREYYRANRVITDPSLRNTVVAKDMTYYTIGMLSRLTNLSTLQLRNLHRRGLLPKCLFVDERGWRLYSGGQVRLIVDTYAEQNQGQTTTADAAIEIKEGWKNAGKEN